MAKRFQKKIKREKQVRSKSMSDITKDYLNNCNLKPCRLLRIWANTLDMERWLRKYGE